MGTFNIEYLAIGASVLAFLEAVVITVCLAARIRVPARSYIIGCVIASGAFIVFIVSEQGEAEFGEVVSTWPAKPALLLSWLLPVTPWVLLVNAGVSCWLGFKSRLRYVGLAFGVLAGSILLLVLGTNLYSFGKVLLHL